MGYGSPNLLGWGHLLVELAYFTLFRKIFSAKNALTFFLAVFTGRWPRGYYWFYWLKHATDNQTLMQEQEKCMQIIYDYEDSIAEAEQIAEARGIEKGFANGLEKGSFEQACEMARSMLANGLSISMISNISGLSEDELKAL